MGENGLQMNGAGHRAIFSCVMLPFNKDQRPGVSRKDKTLSPRAYPQDSHVFMIHLQTPHKPGGFVDVGNNKINAFLNNFLHVREPTPDLYVDGNHCLPRLGTPKKTTVHGSFDAPAIVPIGAHSWKKNTRRVDSPLLSK